MRRGNFMTAPEGGWLHDEQALTVGEGVYYSFPVKVRLGTCTAHAQHAFESELAFFFFFFDNCVAVCNPMQYIGSLQVLESLRTLSMDEKTTLCQ